MFSVRHLSHPFHTAIQLPSFSFIKRNWGRPPVDLSCYLVTERSAVANEDEFCFKVVRAIEGGVTAIQFRDRNEDLQASLRTADRLKSLMKKRGIPLIINNRIDIALSIQADGVHIGKCDFPYAKARALLGSRSIIGLTIETIEDVLAAEKLNVDYLGLQLFPSKQTKPNHNRLWGIEGLRLARQLSHHRIVAIGGIDLNNLEKVLSYLHPGATQDGVAMVGRLWRSQDPYEEAQKIRAIFNRISSTNN